MKKLVSTTIAASAVLLFSISAMAGNGPKGVYETGLVASDGGNVSVAGVSSTGADFNMEYGKAEFDHNGRLEVEIEGLRRSDDATVAEEYFASLVCAGLVVYSTDPVPVELPYGEGEGGYAYIEEDTGLLGFDCSNPAILIRRNGCTVASCGADDPSNTKWLAISGFRVPTFCETNPLDLSCVDPD